MFARYSIYSDICIITMNMPTKPSSVIYTVSIQADSIEINDSNYWVIQTFQYISKKINHCAQAVSILSGNDCRFQ